MRCIGCDSLASPSSLHTHIPCKPRYPRLVPNIFETACFSMLRFDAVPENLLAVLHVEQSQEQA